MSRTNAMNSILVALAYTGLLGATPAVLAQEPEVFEFGSYRDVMELYEGLGYTEDQWDQGLREVSRVYLQNMPERWGKKHSGEVEVKMKKEVFLRTLAPLILRSNELIMEERTRLEQLMASGATDDPWLAELAVKYRVAEPDGPAPDAAAVAELHKRVDIVPNSLALAQTIEESGWGTSRFADVGNSFFGQWAWGDAAIKPDQQRAGKGDYGIAAFATPQDSVNGYMRNINTHRAYADLRDQRATVREEGREPTGADLVGTLVNYSERGQHYVDSLNSIMRYNKLHEVDEAELVGPVILMVPVGEGAN